MSGITAGGPTPSMTYDTIDQTGAYDHAHTSPITAIWRVLTRHILLFVAVAGLVVAAGATLIAGLPRTYSALATVSVPPQQADPLQTTQSGGSAQDDDARTTTEAAMLMSRDVAGAVVTRLGLGLTPQAPSRLATLLCTRLGLRCPHPDAHTTPTLDARIDRFLASLTVLQEPHSRIIDVTVTDRDPRIAAEAANAVVTAEQTLALTRADTDLDRTVGWLDQRTTALREKWLAAVGVANAFRVTHQLTAAGAAAGGSGQGLSEAQVQQGSSALLEAEARLAAAEAQAAALRQGGAAATAADPAVGQMAAQLATISAARAQAAGQLGPDHPELRALDAQVASARASLGAATGRALSAVRDRAAAARTEVAELQSGLHALKGTAGQEAGPVAEFGTLQQEADSARTVYETFLTREKELADRTAILRPPVEFVSHAPIPTEPSAPKRSRLLAGLVLLALAAGAAAVFLREHLARGFSDVGHLRHALRLPLLSVVPRIAGRSDAVLRHVTEDPWSRASEAMRSVVAQIALAAGNDSPQTVLISSADAGEGKTTIALWLATLAATGRAPRGAPNAHGPDAENPAQLPVLLIDGDHRRGLVSRRLGQDHARPHAAPGLTELLAGEAGLADVLQTDQRTGLRFIAAGRATPSPLGQAEIARLQRLLAVLREDFRLIVIDSPPLMGASDALVYARLAHQTVFVCRWRDTSRLAVTTALDRLRQAGARVNGVILSMVDPRAAISYGADYGPRDVRTVRRLYDC